MTDYTRQIETLCAKLRQCEGDIYRLRFNGSPIEENSILLIL